MEDQVWISEGWSLKGTGKSSVDSVNRRRLEPGKELEDRLWIREGWKLEDHQVWIKEVGAWKGTGRSIVD